MKRSALGVLAFTLLFPISAFAMHITEGILPPLWAGFWFVLVAPFFIWGLQEIKRKSIEDARYKSMVAAIKAAGLVETLQGKGPFTVFAPTDDAFAKLPAGTVEDLLKPENKEKLVAILTYHVVPGKVMAADVKTMQVKTVNGKELSIKVEDGKVMVDNAKVIKTDVAAKNGVIHVIDTVVLPK